MSQFYAWNSLSFFDQFERFIFWFMIDQKHLQTNKLEQKIWTQGTNKSWKRLSISAISQSVIRKLQSLRKKLVHTDFTLSQLGKTTAWTKNTSSEKKEPKKPKLIINARN